MTSTIWLADESDASQEQFPIGATIFVAGRGLRPATLYGLHLLGRAVGERDHLLARYTTDRHGVLGLSPLVPYVGFVRNGDIPVRTYGEACESLGTRHFTVRVAQFPGNESDFIQEMRFAVRSRDRDRWLFSCDAEGRMQSGVEQGAARVCLALHNLPAGCVRIYIVPRQFGWRVGDPTEPVSLRDGRVAVHTFDHDGSPARLVTGVETRTLHEAF